MTDHVTNRKHSWYRLAPLALLLAGPCLQAAAFTAGNLVIYRVGTGSGALNGDATAVFLDEYTTSGTLVQSIAMPTAVPALTASGNAPSEGLLTLSTNGAYLVLGGYNCNTGTPGPVAAASNSVNRMVARVDASGTIDVTTSLSDAFSGGNIKSIASVDGSAFWMSGSNEGIRYATHGLTTSTLISNTILSNRCLGIYKGQLYASCTPTATDKILTVGTGLPTTTGQTMNNLTFQDTITGFYGFFFADLPAGVAGVDTLYVAQSTAIRKFCYDGANWIDKGACIVGSTTNYGLVAKITSSTVDLYFTSDGTTLNHCQDTTGYNGTWSTTATALASAGTNKAFRGIAFAPGSVTKIDLISLQTSGAGNQASVSWKTGSEIDNAGFNVWRADKADGTFTKRNDGLIPAKGVAPAGASYTWTDSNVSIGQTWFYKLEDIDTNGVSTFHGPVSVTVGATPSILSFQATPPSIFLGGSSLLNWTVNGTPALSILGMGPVSGTSLSVAPTATTSYTLTDGKATSLATVTVRPFALKDLPGLSKVWGSVKGQAAYDPCYDLNGDGKVDDADVALCLK